LPHGAGESRGGATVLVVGAGVGRKREGGIRLDVLILATHFNRRPELAAAVVFLTTGLSLGSLTLILSILN